MIQMRRVFERVGQREDGAPRVSHDRYFLQAQGGPERFQIVHKLLDGDGGEIKLPIRQPCAALVIQDQLILAGKRLQIRQKIRVRLARAVWMDYERRSVGESCVVEGR